ncbi:MAG: hypothetical protein M0Q87_12150 [Ottowia sp.]|nr:hypothetical protein [Ottowia sp.]
MKVWRPASSVNPPRSTLNAQRSTLNAQRSTLNVNHGGAAAVIAAAQRRDHLSYGRPTKRAAHK